MNQTVEDVHAKIKEWLLEEGYSITQKGDPQAIFNYTVSRGTVPTLTIIQPKGSKDSVVVASGIELDVQSAEKIRSNDEFIWELRKWLLQSGCRFSFLPEFKNFNVIRLFWPVFYDGLTKDSFFRAINKIIDTSVFVMLAIQREIGELPKHQDKYVA